MSQTAREELARSRALIGTPVTEKDFMGEVLRAAQLLKWRTFHVLDSRGSAAGFPDLTLVRGTRLIMAELKRQNGRVSEDQQGWLDDLGKVQTLDTHLWRPSDWNSIEEALR